MLPKVLEQLLLHSLRNHQRHVQRMERTTGNLPPILAIPAPSPPVQLLPLHQPGYTDLIVAVYNTTTTMRQIVRYVAPDGEISYKDLIASAHRDFDQALGWVQEAEGVVLRFGDFGRKKWVPNDQLGDYKTEDVVAIVIAISEDLWCWSSIMDWDWEDNAGCCEGGVPW